MKGDTGRLAGIATILNQRGLHARAAAMFVKNKTVNYNTSFVHTKVKDI